VQVGDKAPGDYRAADRWRRCTKCGARCSEHRFPARHPRDQLPETATRYTRLGNPLFTPEERADPAGVADAFYAYGHFRALGHSVIGIDSVATAARPRFYGRSGRCPPPPADLETLPLAVAYKTLGQLAPYILEHQANGTIDGALLTKQNPDVKIKLGDYTLNVDSREAPVRPTWYPTSSATASSWQKVPMIT